MFNESDPILGPSSLETGFLEEDDEEDQGADRGVEEGPTLEDCFGLPPSSSPSHPSSGDSGEPLSSSYMLFKVCFCIQCQDYLINIQYNFFFHKSENYLDCFKSKTDCLQVPYQIQLSQEHSRHGEWLWVVRKEHC